MKYKYYFLLLIIVLCLFRSNVSIQNNIDDSNIYGVVESYQYKDNYLTFIIDDKNKIKCNYYEDDFKRINIKYGDKVLLTGKLKVPSNNTIPNTFNYKKYLNNNNIYYILDVKKIIIKERTNNIIYTIKNNLENRINKIDNTGYLNTFILGNKNYIDDNAYESYFKIGVIHIFSISGMHISLLADIILFLLNRIKNNKYNSIIVMVFLLFYLVLTNYQASIFRSVVFYSLLCINKIKKLNISSKDILLLSICLILIIFPKYIYNIGFLYSSSISFGLILVKDSFKYNYIINILLISCVSLLISLPITININYSINLLSIIFNIIFVPLISFILYPLSLLTLIIPFLYPLFNILISMIEWISLNLSNINNFVINIPKMSLYIVIIYYLLIYLVLLKDKKYILVLIIFIIILKNINILDNNYYVYYLDVGQGDMSVIKYKDEVIVIDTGCKKYNSNYEITFTHIKFFYSIGINNIDYLILSHGDNDHAGNTKFLVNNFKVNNVILNNDSNNNLEKDIIKSLDKKKIKYYKGIKELKFNNKIIYFLNTTLYDNENDNSNVIYFRISNYKFLFMGDAGLDKERDIIEKYNLSNIDFLKVGHHGSNTSSSIRFINAISPYNCLISVGKNNIYGHPSNDVLKILKNCNIYRTDKNGSIRIKVYKRKYNIDYYNP